MQRHEFRAMGTEIELLLDRPAGLVAERGFAEVEEEFARIERALSRFLPDSELSTLNRNGAIEAGEDLLAATELALAAREQTHGLFDPTVHDALVAAGYDRSFERVDRDSRARPSAAPPSVGGAIEVDHGSGTIRLAPNVHVDLGGIGKGYAVDRAAKLLARYGPCLVNAGGDLVAHGRRWPVGVETSWGFMTLELVDGALATSGSDRRRWRRAGVEQHHLIDPATGCPAASDLRRATVVARTAAQAEVVAKVLFLVGEREAVRRATTDGISGVLVTTDGRTVLTGELG